MRGCGCTFWRNSALAITATAGNAATKIEPRRPSWADMHKHYPATMVNTDTLYNTMIRGDFKGQEKASWLENTCATRMSYALLRSGFQLAKTQDPKASMQGEDKKWYWIRVAELKAELKSRFKGYDAELNFDAINTSSIDNPLEMMMIVADRKEKAQKFLDTTLANKNGIIVFVVKGWGNATGHFTLWDGTTKTLAFAGTHGDQSQDTYYPWLTEVRKDLLGKKTVVQVSEIRFWELK